jgi:23S rRNA pseudouridine1911/1915/1917 synthase
MTQPGKKSPKPAKNAKPPRKPAPRPALLHADGDIIAIDKPSGMPVSESPRALRETVHGLTPEALRNPAAALEPVHRLEKHASGVLLMARTAGAFESLMRQFDAGQAVCVYEALVLGYVPSPEGEVVMPLVYDKRLGKMIAHESRGRAATTRWRVLERLAGHTLLECRPHPGLVHQVRLHMLTMGYPLAVDSLYGGGTQVLLSHFKTGYRTSSRHEERPLINRLSLHLARIEFAHPATGAAMTIESPRPRDLKATVTQLARAM